MAVVSSIGKGINRSALVAHLVGLSTKAKCLMSLCTALLHGARVKGLRLHAGSNEQAQPQTD